MLRRHSKRQFQKARQFFDKPFDDAKGLHVIKRPENFVPLSGVDLIELFGGSTTYAVPESEMFHRRERWAEGIGNLCRRRYLLVEVIAVDNHGKGTRLGLFMGIHLHTNILVTELE